MKPLMSIFFPKSHEEREQRRLDAEINRALLVEHPRGFNLLARHVSGESSIVFAVHAVNEDLERAGGMAPLYISRSPKKGWYIGSEQVCGRGQFYCPSDETLLTCLEERLTVIRMRAKLCAPVVA